MNNMSAKSELLSLPRNYSREVAILEYDNNGLRFSFDSTRLSERYEIPEIKVTPISLNFIDTERTTW